MLVKFNSIEIEGFRSIVDPQIFNLNRPGLNMVRGTNGVGKTTLFEALVWNLYGVNLKGTPASGVQSWKEVRPKKFAGTRVAVYFTVGEDQYIIERHVKYTGVGDALLIYKNEDMVPELDKKDGQTYIDNLLTMDYKTFMNSFMFGQRMTRLVESSSADKRKLFEELFDMDWIQKMRDKVSEDRAQVALDLERHAHTINSKEISIGMLEDAVEEAQETYNRKKELEDTQEEERLEKLKGLQEKKKELAKEIDGLNAELNAIPLYYAVPKTPSDVPSLNARLSVLEREYDELKDGYDEIWHKVQSNEAKMEAADDGRYEAHLGQLTQLDRKMLDIVHDLYGQDAGLPLSEQEQIDIENDYETKLTAYNQLQATINAKQRELDGMEGKAFCPTCKRPFDNADDIEKHKQEIYQEIEGLSKELATSKAGVDMARADVTQVHEYQNLEVQKNSLSRNAPADPTELKEKLTAENARWKIDLEQHEERIAATSKEEKEITAKLQSYESLYAEIDDANRKNESIEIEKGRINGLLDLKEEAWQSVTAELSRTELFQSELPDLQKKIDEKQGKLDTANEELAELKLDQEELETAVKVRDFWLKKVFAANGLKAYIFKAMLDELNQYTTKYGNKLGCSIRFSLDLTKTSAPFSTICSLGDRINKDYREFSGGQKQRLDIVLIFAMHDLLSSTTGLNILIMDEVFEGLDEEGTSAVFELIAEKAETKSVYVISHSQTLDTLHSKSIDITENNGKTILP